MGTISSQLAFYCGVKGVHEPTSLTEEQLAISRESVFFKGVACGRIAPSLVHALRSMYTTRTRVNGLLDLENADPKSG